MAAKFDPNIELNPNPLLIFITILVLAGFGVVVMIIMTGDPQTDEAAAAP